MYIYTWLNTSWCNKFVIPMSLCLSKKKKNEFVCTENIVFAARPTRGTCNILSCQFLACIHKIILYMYTWGYLVIYTDQYAFTLECGSIETFSKGWLMTIKECGSCYVIKGVAKVVGANVPLISIWLSVSTPHPIYFTVYVVNCYTLILYTTYSMHIYKILFSYIYVYIPIYFGMWVNWDIFLVGDSRKITGLWWK